MGAGRGHGPCMTTSSAGSSRIPALPSTPTAPAVRPTLTARCPEDLLALVPVVLGFFPTDSIAMLTFGGRETFHARVDLPPPRSTPDDPADLDEVVGALVGPASKHGVERVVLVVYTCDAGLAVRAFRLLCEEFARAGVGVVEVLRADGARWWPLAGPVRGFPDHGVPYDVRHHPFLVEAVLQGRVTRGSRGDLAAGLATDPLRAAAVARLVVEQDDGPAGPGRASSSVRALVEGEWVEATVRRHLADGSRPADEDVARLLRALRVPALRDAAWCSLDRSTASAHVDLWTWVLRRTPSDLRAPVATLLAFAAWQDGEGALAWCALDVVAAADPGYRLAAMLARCLEHAVPPSEWSSEADWRAGLATGRPGVRPPRG